MTRIEYRSLDIYLIGCALALSIIGIFMIYSAQYDATTGTSLGFYFKQILWLVVALGVFWAVLHIPLRLIEYSAIIFYPFSILLLVAVFFIGEARMGASRWFALGPLSLSPSDIAKLALLVALSTYLAYTKKHPESMSRLGASALLALIPTLLVMKQPDLGSSLVFVALLFSLWFWSGLSPLYMILIVSPFIALVTAVHWISLGIYLVLLITYVLVLKPGFLTGFVTVLINLAFGAFYPFFWSHLEEYQKLRVLTFLDPGRDPQRAGYQIIQSKIAIGSGGLLGKGYLGGSQSQLKFLPERHTDFIFSVLGEEFGLIGTVIVLLIFGFLFWRCITIANRSRSRFASYLAWGALTILFFQFYVNVGMTFGLMPVTGLPMPFLSYGGTSLVLSWTLVGIIIMANYSRTEY